MWHMWEKRRGGGGRVISCHFFKHRNPGQQDKCCLGLSEGGIFCVFVIV
jgi:hypothetical protein